MSEDPGKGGWRRLFRPSTRWSIASLLALGIVIGIAGLLTFDTVLHATSTDEFCTSCHEMQIPLAQLQETVHYTNHSGVSAGCADCHVPREFIPKMVRKVQAAREVWGSITGVIDTPEKYAAHLEEMKAREIARLQANDSQECRNCHTAERMTSIAGEEPKRFHRALASGRRTCIDCHDGIAHPGQEG
ncbi:Denitrification system component NirT [Mangrovimicrobium sediminis]|uniref:Cytochrome c-type protein n=1 Tax=Mangrovimicrobium sediminis TaxID=2562682 RepID=A0A4Z0M3Y9_9GAMM|nr:Denitrification system component NirT [Haliea sp. SAOS-164]